MRGMMGMIYVKKRITDMSDSSGIANREL